MRRKARDAAAAATPRRRPQHHSFFISRVSFWLEATRPSKRRMFLRRPHELHVELISSPDIQLNALPVVRLWDAIRNRMDA